MSEWVRGELEYRHRICAELEDQIRWVGPPLKMCTRVRAEGQCGPGPPDKKGFSFGI